MQKIHSLARAVALLLPLACGGLPSLGAEVPSRPNILLILADDNDWAQQRKGQLPR
jgi:hypothetical protein